ncbi:acyltransferase [Leucobacter sp. UT-8R-CII-1-4]|nr:acyltransferase [Leucobacter sp. UT-8R-CII-1-4]
MNERVYVNKQDSIQMQAVLAEPTPRLDVLTGLRWWAAFMVFLFHMRVFAPLPGPINALFDQGYFGVTFFFVLSGFVLTWSARPGVSTSTFYWRRFARIWPAHMVALLLAIPVFYTLSPIPEGSFLKPFDIGVLLLSVILVQGWSANPAILFSGNPAAWTLTVEALFYFSHPWVSKVLTVFRVRGALLVVASVMVWAFGYRLALVIWPGSFLAHLPMPITRLPEFFLGMALAWAMRCGWRPRISPFVAIAALVGLLALIVGARALPGLLIVAQLGNEFFTLAVGLVIVAFTSATLRGKRSLFESRWQVKFGEWSFAFYLIHATVIYLALRVFGFHEPSWRNLAWFAVIFVIDLLLAWLLHSFVEKPLERRMRRWKDNRDLRKAAG